MNHSLIDELDAYDFDVCDWGSCQYAGAQQAYHVFMDKVDKQGLAETTKEFGKELGIKVTPAGLETMIWNNNTVIKDIKDEIRQGQNYDSDMAEEEVRDNEMINNIKTIDDAFRVLRKFAYDLWSAAPLIAKSCGITVVAQGENLVTGLYCALLKATDLVKNEKVFGGFDT